MRSDRERVLDIFEAIDKIDQRITGDIDTFANDEMQQVWAIHHLLIIGEAANALSPQFRNTHPEIPWKQIIGMRHVLIHGYFQIDLDAVWTAIEKDLPPLKNAIVALLGGADN